MYESLDLVANSAEVANIWVTGLRYETTFVRCGSIIADTQVLEARFVFDRSEKTYSWLIFSRYLMQYGKHALDMLASSQDSLRLVWLEQLFSSAVDPDGKEDAEEGIPLQAALALIQSVNPGVSGSKVEQRFKELQRVRDRMCGLTLDNGAEDKERKENKRLVGKREQVIKQEFIEVFHDFCTRPEIYFLLVQFSSNKEFLDTKDMMRFLEAEQGMTVVGIKTSAHKNPKAKVESRMFPTFVSESLVLLCRPGE